MIFYYLNDACRWLFFPPKDLLYLYPVHTPLTTDTVFEVDLDTLDLSHYPLLSVTSTLECTLQAGEILFVPAGCPHRVKNMETSLAVSANYVDTSNLDRVKNELQLDSLVDHQAGDELLAELQSGRSCMCSQFV